KCGTAGLTQITELSARCRVFGNANMDENIDSKDITYLEGVIRGTNAATRFCDANYDGKIDADDIDQIEKIIRGDNTELTVLDLADRAVTIKTPVERIVLVASRNIQEFVAVGGGKDFIKKVVGWGPELKASDKDTYEKYSERFPELEEIPDVGSPGKGTFSTEKVISLKPDVVIFPTWLIGSVDDDIEKIEQVGIPSIYLDHYVYDDFAESTLLLGKILDNDVRAQELVKYHQDQEDKVLSRLKSISAPVPKVYAECGNLGPSEYSNSFGKGIAWDRVIEKCRGINIIDDMSKANMWPVISPEYLLKQNPDVIIITGSHWPAVTDSMRLGYYADPDDSKGRLETFTKRHGWDTLSAIKRDRVYSIYHTLPDRIYKFAALQAVAKCLYPEEFKDLDPENSIKEFHEKFLPVDYSGIWMVSLEE
ncbi:MAG TPA: ABC transporter substrate-binding protein, partial [Methanotrichaceae archaeon]|nr:ABC transporter substrate-binding protein [Methanotrichaceae archaeon]HQF17702.1 ABC transporter substrate-binding protein [Methanotrichaceae archaeon]HQI92321.1 ABC transporter substrate-binding protein [Methanotrichaceae archaeon]HQJ29417.1 ABC transporter substrate-binding protein [Methanotrichaceae archaeon]